MLERGLNNWPMRSISNEDNGTDMTAKTGWRPNGWSRQHPSLKARKAPAAPELRRFIAPETAAAQCTDYSSGRSL